VSRTNPHKAKPRFANQTAIIVVEGHTEEAFCKHLKREFGRDCGVKVTILNAKGGSPRDVVAIALKQKGFDRTFVFFDTDVELPKTWATKSKAAGHIHLTPSPCVEAVFLQLLGKHVPRITDDCKKGFQEFMNDKQKCLPEGYTNLYPKEILQASSIPLIKTLLTAFEIPAS